MSGFLPPSGPGYNPSASQYGYGSGSGDNDQHSQSFGQPFPPNYATPQARHPMYQQGRPAPALLEYYPTSTSAGSAPSGSNATQPWPIQNEAEKARYDMMVKNLETRAPNVKVSSRQGAGLKNAIALAIDLDRDMNCETFIAWLGSLDFHLDDAMARKVFKSFWQSKKIDSWPENMSAERRQRLERIHKKLGTRKRGERSDVSKKQKILTGQIWDLAQEVFPCIDNKSVSRLLESKGFYLGGDLSNYLPDKKNEDLPNKKNKDIAKVTRASLPDRNVIELGQWPENMGDENLARFVNFKSQLGTRERASVQQVSGEKLEGYTGLYDLANELFDNPTRAYFCHLLASIDFHISTDSARKLEKKMAAKKAAAQEYTPEQNEDDDEAVSQSGYGAYGGARSSPAPGAQQNYNVQHQRSARARFEHNLLPPGAGSTSSGSNTINQGLWSGANRDEYTAMQGQLGKRKKSDGPVSAKQGRGIEMAFNLAIELITNLTPQNFCTMLSVIGFYISPTDNLVLGLFSAREQAAPQSTAPGYSAPQETALEQVAKRHPPIVQETREIFPASEMSQADLKLFETWIDTLHGTNFSDFLTDDQDTALKRIFRGARLFHSKKYSKRVKFHDICDALEALVPTGPSRRLIWDTLWESGDVDDRDVDE